MVFRVPAESRAHRPGGGTLRMLSRRGRIMLAAGAAMTMPAALLLAAPAPASSAPSARLPFHSPAAASETIGAGPARSLPAGQQRDCAGPAAACQGVWL